MYRDPEEGVTHNTESVGYKFGFGSLRSFADVSSSPRFHAGLRSAALAGLNDRARSCSTIAGDGYNQICFQAPTGAEDVSPGQRPGTGSTPSYTSPGKGARIRAGATPCPNRLPRILTGDDRRPAVSESAGSGDPETRAERGGATFGIEVSCALAGRGTFGSVWFPGRCPGLKSCAPSGLVGATSSRHQWPGLSCCKITHGDPDEGAGVVESSEPGDRFGMRALFRRLHLILSFVS